MSIRLRTVVHEGQRVRVALCAVESDPEPYDLLLDDGDQYALAAKFLHDRGLGGDPVVVAAMESQKMRDAREELLKWDAAGRPCGLCGKLQAEPAP